MQNLKVFSKKFFHWKIIFFQFSLFSHGKGKVFKCLHTTVCYTLHISLYTERESERERESFFPSRILLRFFFQMKYWKIWKYKEKIKSKKKMGSEGNSTKNIVVLGSEGVGKSSLCIRFF